VIEKSKTEVSGPNGGSTAPDEEMTEAPAAHEAEKAGSADAKPVEDTLSEIQDQPAEAKSDELAEAPVEVEGGKDLPSIENGEPEQSEASNEAPKIEADDVAPSETKGEDTTVKATNGDTAVEDYAPEHDTPSSILEKGTDAL
jgi:hypothetical protein